MSAKKLAEEYIKSLGTPEMKLSEVEDTSDYYCFSYFHPTEIYVGQGLIFINKLDNRFFIYGSGNSDPKTDYKIKLEQEKMARKIFPEFDIRKNYNIKINRILRKMNLIEKLLELGFSYTTPEIVGSDIFRISKPYNQKLFENRLSKLPCEFNNINAKKVWNILSLNKEKKVVEFTIAEYINVKKENRVERATETDLETAW
ncbi:hypothetical protein DS884_00130 [Tenacibaculum sp. E3R01]|uniref:hypothetical protein n=1 Tax=Tenacibaculum sp. E3R01 TaxID=2267227 RepID=UPI000DEBB3F4|nr:hypothetical protein [Tenacibaculum sp. E3R01]RBW63431.1 hypothetical protein DS884_00130 [Tenacibaculum sp. E3R01]